MIKMHTLDVLAVNNGNRTQTALDLGICVRTLRTWLTSWGIAPAGKVTTHKCPECGEWKSIDRDHLPEFCGKNDTN